MTARLNGRVAGKDFVGERSLSINNLRLSKIADFGQVSIVLHVYKFVLESFSRSFIEG